MMSRREHLRFTRACCAESWPMEELVAVWSKGYPDRFEKTKQFVRVAIRDGGLRCRCCGLDLYLYDSYNALDHVIPSRPHIFLAARDGTCKRKKTCGQAQGHEIHGAGGSSNDDNVVIACRDCNGLKGVYVPGGETLEARVEAAGLEIARLRADRITTRELLERLIREARA